MMVIPGHLIFSYTISYLQAGHTSFTPIFIMIYLIAAMLQVQHINFNHVLDVTIRIVFLNGWNLKGNINYTCLINY